MFLRVSLHLKIIFTGQCTWPTFRWIRCPEFLIRWIQLVVDFFVAFFVAFAVTWFVHRGFFACEDDLYRALRLICIVAGFNGFVFHILWIQLVVGFSLQSASFCSHLRCLSFDPQPQLLTVNILSLNMRIC